MAGAILHVTYEGGLKEQYGVPRGWRPRLDTLNEDWLELPVPDDETARITLRLRDIATLSVVDEPEAQS